MASLTLHPVNEGVVAVHLASGEPVGHLKRIGGLWKFKAMGYEDGNLVPGGGPLTHQHNRSFAALDIAHISAALRQ
ncbi:MAG: hypothetical protein M9919_15255 [Burkholderiaceae bacterium]|jgi:hypothetical protein|nr:hypothetical protein [Burkholderiaceae bacterium]MCO5105352.1 hypothetical protein [Burkholderiaceae bacterium]